jgi:hypothetical protein
MTEEDEAFNEVEKRSKVKQEIVRSMNRKRQIMSINPYRDQVIEEVAQQVEKQFGLEVATYIRELKQ